MRDGAEVAVEVFLRHADAVVGHGDGAGILVEGDVDAELVFRQLDAGVGEAFEVQLVNRIRCVGDELAQKDFAVGVDGIDHEVEQLFALCLEFAHVRRFLSVRARRRGIASRASLVESGTKELSLCPTFACKRAGERNAPRGAGRVSSLTA